MKAEIRSFLEQKGFEFTNTIEDEIEVTECTFGEYFVFCCAGWDHDMEELEAEDWETIMKHLVGCYESRCGDGVKSLREILMK